MGALRRGRPGKAVGLGGIMHQSRPLAAASAALVCGSIASASGVGHRAQYAPPPMEKSSGAWIVLHHGASATIQTIHAVRMKGTTHTICADPLIATAFSCS